MQTDQSQLAMRTPMIRWCSTGRLQQLLEKQLKASRVKVQDISGGCGAMFSIEVVSEMFQNKSRVAQHRMVTDALSSEIESMHGLTVKTLTPDQAK